MNATRESPGFRRPDSAHAPRIKLHEAEVKTYLNERRPGIQTDAGPLVDPAVFVVGNSDFYFRADWANWYPVSSECPDHLKALAAVPSCAVTRTSGNEIRDFSARVYRIPALPAGLFPANGDDDWDDDGEPGEDDSDLEPATVRQLILEALPQRFEECGLSGDCNAFPHVVLGGEPVDFIVSSDDRCILFGVMPPEFDEFRAGEASFPAPDGLAQAVDSFLQRMKRLERRLRDLESDADIHLALLENSDLADWLVLAFDGEFDGAEVEIVPVVDFEDCLKRYFP